MASHHQMVGDKISILMEEYFDHNAKNMLKTIESSSLCEKDMLTSVLLLF